MESQQVPNDGLPSETRSDVAPAEVAASFHRFGDLPVELQLDIWDHTFPPLARNPGVLCFKLTVCRNSKSLVACFNPDEHVASSTLAHRTLLAICRYTRHEVLGSLNTLTLVRFDESSGTGTRFRVPLDFEKSCFCIDGWDRHGMRGVSFRNIIGTDFAKRVKRLAFVIQDDDLSYHNGRIKLPLERAHIRVGLSDLALLFHNTTQIGGITRSMSVIRDSVAEDTFISLFSFQNFTQKEMVEGFLLTQGYAERTRSFRDAICLAFEGWRERLQAAVLRATDGSVAS